MGDLITLGGSDWCTEEEWLDTIDNLEGEKPMDNSFISLGNKYGFPRQRRLPSPSILIARYPWVTQSNQKILLSADLDGALCFAFDHHFSGATLGGLFNMYGVSMARGVRPQDCIGVDSEFLTKCPHSVGHHFALTTNNQLNTNVEARVIPSKEFLLLEHHTSKTLGPYFVRKFNLALIFFKYYLYDVPLPTSDEARALLLKADSTFETFYKYAFIEEDQNPREHFLHMGMQSIIDFLDGDNWEIGSQYASRDKAKFHPRAKEIDLIYKQALLKRGVRWVEKPNVAHPIQTAADIAHFIKLVRACSDILGFGPIPDSAFSQMANFEFTPLYKYEMQWSPSVVPAIIDLDLWTNAIVNCGNTNGIAFGVTLSNPIDLERYRFLRDKNVAFVGYGQRGIDDAGQVVEACRTHAS